MNIKEALQLLGHRTEVAGLHPFQQARFDEARSVLHSLGDDSPLVIGCTNAWSVAKYFFAAKDKTGAKAEALDLPAAPAIAYLGDFVDLGQVPAPVIFTVPSTTSRAACSVYYIFNSVNDLGYGALDDAECFVDMVCDDWDAAQERVRVVGNALKTFVAVCNMDDRRKEMGLRGGDEGPSF